jgi:hypothetical protein
MKRNHVKDLGCNTLEESLLDSAKKRFALNARHVKRVLASKLKLIGSLRRTKGSASALSQLMRRYRSTPWSNRLLEAGLA